MPHGSGDSSEEKKKKVDCAGSEWISFSHTVFLYSTQTKILSVKQWKVIPCFILFLLSCFKILQPVRNISLAKVKLFFIDNWNHIQLSFHLLTVIRTKHSLFQMIQNYQNDHFFNVKLMSEIIIFLQIPKFTCTGITMPLSNLEKPR